MVGSAISGRNGKSEFLGALFGAIVGPLFALLLLLDKPKLKGMRNCPFCLEPIKRHAAVCRHCRREVPPVSPLAPQ